MYMYMFILFIINNNFFIMSKVKKVKIRKN